MCGIVGYIGSGNALQILVESLRRLDYRGYNAIDISYKNGGAIETCSAAGSARELIRMLPRPLPAAGIGLGHTCWATRLPTAAEQTVHPVDNGIAVVHKGIIENYQELKAWLQECGGGVRPEGDNNVIPRLIARFRGEGLDLQTALVKTVALLQGTFALGVLCDDAPETLFAVMHGSPLAVGIGTNECIFSSDISALRSHTGNVLLLEDGEICALSRSGVDIRSVASANTLSTRGRIVAVPWYDDQPEKEGYEHFMLKEIHEQPEAVVDTLSEWVEDLDGLLETIRLAEVGTRLRRIHIVASGTSYHAGLIGRYIIEKFVHIPVCVDMASEFRHMEPVLSKGTILATISQSGETIDTLMSQRRAHAKGIPVLTICNVVGSSASREADAVLYTRAGREVGVVATKTFTAQIAALCVLGIGLGVHRKKLQQVELQTLKSFLAALPCLIRKALGRDREIREIARTLTDARGMLYVGEGISYPVALEGALKMKELAYIHAVGCPAGEIKHGPLALVESGSPVVVLAPLDSLYTKVLPTMEDLARRGGRIIAVTDAPAALKGSAAAVIPVPSVHPAFLPFVSAIPLQLLAYHVAVLKGHDVDRPRSLEKSVTAD